MSLPRRSFLARLAGSLAALAGASSLTGAAPAAEPAPALPAWARDFLALLREHVGPTLGEPVFTDGKLLLATVGERPFPDCEYEAPPASPVYGEHLIGPAWGYAREAFGSRMRIYPNGIVGDRGDSFTLPTRYRPAAEGWEQQDGHMIFSQGVERDVLALLHRSRGAR